MPGFFKIQYLLDADVLINAHRHIYPYDVCPGFWDYLEKANRSLIVASVRAVYKEIKDSDPKQRDWLGWWAVRNGSSFFLNPDQQVFHAQGRVMDWVRNEGFATHAEQKFARAADPWLIAQALVDESVVVTSEVHAKMVEAKNSIKIPDVCSSFNIECCNLNEMLQRENVRFTLGG